MPQHFDTWSALACDRTEPRSPWPWCAPSAVRLRIRCRSYSANPPSTVSMSLPAAVVVCAQLSPRLRNVAPTLPIASSVLSKSLVDLASLSRLSPNAAIALASCGRSLCAPLIFSANILAQPAPCTPLSERVTSGHQLKLWRILSTSFHAPLCA